MPPAGGFEAIKYKRNLPFRGPSGVVILGAVTAVCAYGFWRVGLGNLEKRYVEVSTEGLEGRRSCALTSPQVRRTLSVASHRPARRRTWLALGSSLDPTARYAVITERA